MIASRRIVRRRKGVFVTVTGLATALAELEYLKKTRRGEVVERIQRAREFGDLEENSEYDAAMDEQALVENRIAEIETTLKDAKVVAKKAANDFVVIGSTVVVEMDGEKDEFTLVGKMEANPAQKKISNESPVGSALLGARVGEKVEVSTPIVKYTCKVLAIK